MMRSILLLHTVILAATLHDEDTGSVICIHYLFVPPRSFFNKRYVQAFGLGSGAKEFEPG